jgi:hypothetical protein
MPTPTDSLGPDVIDALRQGRTIDAIRFLRKEKGIGLKEAKDIIDSIDAQLPAASARGDENEARAPAKRAQPATYANPGGYSPGEMPRSYNAAWVVMVLAAAAAIGYYFFY